MAEKKNKKEQNECFVVTSVQDAFQHIVDHESLTNTKYVVESTRYKNFGQTAYNPVANHYILWEEKGNKGLPFSGVPFIVINHLYFNCEHGPVKHATYKPKLPEENSDHCNVKTRTVFRISKKLGCLAKVHLKEVIYFPEYKISSNTEFRRKSMSKKLRDDLKCEKIVQQERKIIVQLPPSSEHTNHIVQTPEHTEHSYHVPEGGAELIYLDEKLKLKITKWINALFSYIVTLPNHVQTEIFNQIKRKLDYGILKKVSLLPGTGSTLQTKGDMDMQEPKKVNIQKSNSSFSEIIESKSPSQASILLNESVLQLEQLHNEIIQNKEINDIMVSVVQNEECILPSERQSEECTKSSSENNTKDDQQSKLNPTISNSEAEDKSNKPVIIPSCDICDKHFNTQHKLAAHIKTHNTDISPYKCHICDKRLAQKSGLDRHLRRHTGIKPYKCDKCDYSTAVKIDLLRHFPVHTKERNYMCEKCGKSYLTDLRLKDHIKHVHHRSITEVCEVCGFCTHSKEIMRRHYKVKHTDQETFVCPVCNVTIKQKGSFLVHMRIHTGEQPYSCKKCTKTFKSNSELAIHARSHREGEFICEVCDRKFKLRSHLYRHVITHTDAKPFSCHLCSYTCNVKANITKHVRTVHNLPDFTMKEPLSKVITKDGTVTPAVERGLNVAEECLKIFSSKLGMELTLQALQQKQTSSDNNVSNTNKLYVSKPIDELNSVVKEQNIAVEARTSAKCDILSNAMKLLVSNPSNVEEIPVLTNAVFGINNNINICQIPVKPNGDSTEVFISREII